MRAVYGFPVNWGVKELLQNGNAPRSSNRPFVDSECVRLGSEAKYNRRDNVGAFDSPAPIDRRSQPVISRESSVCVGSSVMWASEGRPNFFSKGLRRLEYRGYDSAGIATLTPSGEMTSREAVGRINQLAEALAERRHWGRSASATPAGRPTDPRRKPTPTRTWAARRRSPSFTTA